MKKTTQRPTCAPSVGVSPPIVIDTSSAPTSATFAGQKTACRYQIVELLQQYQHRQVFLHPRTIAERLGLRFRTVRQNCRFLADAGFIRRKQITGTFKRRGMEVRCSFPYYFIDESCRSLGGPRDAD